MLRISALNESGGSLSDTDSSQVETREAQEANLLNLYTTSLKHLSNKNVLKAKENLLEIINSSIFKEDKEDSLALSLKYNVHKNLGECYLQEGDISQAQQEMLTATELDAGDVTLWFKIAGTAVKLKNLYMCRSALEQGLRACSNHWPSIDNLITVTFKLGDFLACLGYCAMAEEIDPKFEKIVLYKSKVYNEMPFLQEAYSDTDFQPIHTEIETFHATPKKEPPREPLKLDLSELSLECLAQEIYNSSEYCDEHDKSLHSVDTASAVTRLQEARQRHEDMKIRVSVQNVVDEIIDIIEEEEEIIACCEEIVDEMICDMFGVEPKPTSEKVASHIVDVLVSNIFDPSYNKKKSVVIEAKPRERKRANIMDEIPQELIEKRRSSRKAKFQEAAQISDACPDPVRIQTPRELLESFMPAVLKVSKGFNNKFNDANEVDKENSSKSNDDATIDSATKEHDQSLTKKGVSKSLFGTKSNKTWFTEEEEKAEVEKFLAENTGKTIWHLMRAFLDYVFRLENCLIWPEDLVTWTGKVYQCWRLHLGDPLCVENPAEKFTQEFLRYYIIGCECTIGTLLQQDIDKDSISPVLSNQLHQDLEELYTIHGHLTIDLKLRVHSLRFFYFSIIEYEDEVLYETGQLMNVYHEHPGIPIFSSLPQYKIATKKRLEEYSKDVSLNKELEELNQYYESERYEDIVKLVLGTLESNKFTPSKDASRVPDRETQIDILIESLLHTGRYKKCIEWSTKSLGLNLEQMLVDVETGETRKLNSQDLEVVNSYLDIINSCIDNNETKDFGDTSLDTASSLTAILTKLLDIQINDMTPQTVISLPWIIMHKLLVWTENNHAEQMTDSDDSIPGSLSLLFSAHDYLGQKSCCTSEKGILLNYIVDVFVPIMTQQRLPKYSDQIKTNLDQALYCLFAHPSKKSRVRHLVDHGVSQIALTWARATVIYRYLRPDKVPEHDDVKLMSISADCENFMKRVVALIPESVSIHKRRITAELVVQGKKERPKVKKFAKLPTDLNDLFYFLADYAFKNSMDLERAQDLFTLDISFNPDRYETWAALALTLANRIDKKLNSCKKLNPVKMLESYESVKNCFDHYISMNDGNSNMFIEYANFSYNFQSFISRTLNNNSENMTMALFEKLEKTKEECYKTATKHFNHTLTIFQREGIDPDDVDERWLIHYMLGKIKEKTNCSLLDSLDSYKTSIQYLEKNGAILPKKVNYNSPQTWSVECLEVYYRVHASVLKYLVKFETNVDGVDLESRRKIFGLLRDVQLNKIYVANAHCDKSTRFSIKRKVVNSVDTPTVDKEAKLETSTSIMDDVVEVLDHCIQEVEYALDPAKMDVPALVNLCLLGLEDVAVHFYHHFKSVYRLAHYYFTSQRNKNMVKVERLILAGEKDKSAKFPGLFFGRKPTQVFNEIWRIPVNEIDRPGSFAAHCAKCLMLMIDVLRLLPDLGSLTDIAIQMRKPPSEENKFVHESDRVEVGTIASTYLFNTIKSRITSESVDKTSLLLELHKIYQKMQKQWSGKEKEVLGNMKELYCKVKGRPESDKISNEEVLRFCITETKIKMGKPIPASLLMSSQNTTQHSNKSMFSSMSTSSSTAGRASTNDVTALPSRSDITKDFSQIANYIQKVCNVVETLALSLPNTTLKDMLLFAELKYEEQQAKMNKLLQQLCMMTKTELTNVGVDHQTLTKLTMYANKIGVSVVAINNHVTRIKGLLEGTASTLKTNKPSSSMAVNQSSGSGQTIVTTTKQPLSLPTTSASKQNNSFNAIVQKQQEITNFISGATSSNSSIKTSSQTIQSKTNTVGSSPSLKTQTSGSGSVKTSQQKQPLAVKQTTKFKQSTNEKEMYQKKMKELEYQKKMKELEYQKKMKEMMNKHNQKVMFQTAAQISAASYTTQQQQQETVQLLAAAYQQHQQKLQQQQQKKKALPKKTAANNPLPSGLNKHNNSGQVKGPLVGSTPATKNLVFNPHISITSAASGNKTGAYSSSSTKTSVGGMGIGKSPSVLSNPVAASSSQDKGATERILNLPAGVTLTHIKSKPEQVTARTASPAMARVSKTAANSNPGSRSSSPKSVSALSAGGGSSNNSSRTSSPAFLGASRGVSPAAGGEKVKSIISKAQGGDVSKNKTAVNELKNFKDKMFKSLNMKPQQEKSQVKKKPSQPVSKAAVVTNLTAANKSVGMAGKLSGSAGVSNKPSGSKQPAAKTAPSKPKDQEIICIDID